MNSVPLPYDLRSPQGPQRAPLGAKEVSLTSPAEKREWQS